MGDVRTERQQPVVVAVMIRAEQRRRFTQAMDEKARRYGERYPLDEDFLDAVAKMPEASGVALGFDRLVMLASGALRIDQVVWTPPAGEA